MYLFLSTCEKNHEFVVKIVIDRKMTKATYIFNFKMEDNVLIISAGKLTFFGGTSK